MSRRITLTGPSGIGKTYVKRKAKESYSLKEPAIYTTRPLRCEEESDERISITEKEFNDLENRGEFIFVNNIFGYRYGLKKDIYFSSDDLILELYVDNIETFRIKRPDAYMIAMIPLDLGFLEERLKKRVGKCHEYIYNRIEHAKEEIEKIKCLVHIFNELYVVKKQNETEVLYSILRDIEDFLRREK